ncbi:MAG TPA: SoxY-related AACIE arm protein [Hyphomicrobiaceae bacterium]|nr:SoxY-related AACIE arm protein [Hyphomicrobiaceae bacterium]
MTSDAGQDWKATRREVLKVAGALAVGCTVPAVAVTPAAATPAEMQAAVGSVIGDAKINDGKVNLDIPPLVENGNTVPCTVTVESPMTAADHVRAIHVFTEKNPQPYVISVALGPRAGRARVSTRIRLRDTQTVLAVAEMSDGTFWSDRAHVIVTVSACLEDVL